MPQIRKIDKAAAIDKDIQIVIAEGAASSAAAWPAISATRASPASGAVDKKPLAAWYQRVPGVECPAWT